MYFNDNIVINSGTNLWSIEDLKHLINIINLCNDDNSSTNTANILKKYTSKPNCRLLESILACQTYFNVNIITRDTVLKYIFYYWDQIKYVGSERIQFRTTDNRLIKIAFNKCSKIHEFDNVGSYYDIDSLEFLPNWTEWMPPGMVDIFVYPCTKYSL